MAGSVLHELVVQVLHELVVQAFLQDFELDGVVHHMILKHFVVDVGSHEKVDEMPGVGLVGATEPLDASAAVCKYLADVLDPELGPMVVQEKVAGSVDTADLLAELAA